MENIKIVWKKNYFSGENAYVGKIKVASYCWNANDSRNGKYMGASLLADSKLTFKTDDVDEIKKLVEQDVKEFFEKLGV